MKATSIAIIERLRERGFKAYFAGGCVRDMLLQRKPSDFDIATDATPQEIESIFQNTYAVGKKFGVMLVRENGFVFEVATFRSDSGYSDGRRPDFVTFEGPKEDALRRDFTINALFYDPINEEFLDFVDGMKDIDARILRFVGDPTVRIKEDHLRLLRAVRFKNVLNFQWDQNTYAAIKEQSALVGDVSGERIAAELNKLMLDDSVVKALEELFDLGLLHVLFPELEELKGLAQPLQYHKEGDVFVHSLKTLDAAVHRTDAYLDIEFLKDMQGGIPEPSAFHVRFASLLHDIAKKCTFGIGKDTKGVTRIKFDKHAEKSEIIVESILRRLKFPLKDIEHIKWLTSHHMMLNTLIDMGEGSRNKWFRHPYFIDLMEVFYADIAGTEPSRFKDFNELNHLYHAWLLHRPVEMPKLLSGEEIMEITGCKAGKKLGEIVSALEHEVHAGTVTTKEQAIDFVRTFAKKI